jgi:hypothetical protein
LRLRLFVAFLVGALGMLIASPALAHTSKQEGLYKLTVGWLHEPTYVGIENAVQVLVHDSMGQPVDDVGDNFKVVVMTGDQKSDPLSFNASFDPDTGLGTHGEFDAAIIPTRPGNYTFHFMGSLKGQQVDDSFTSSDMTFDTAKDPAPAEFPAKDPTIGDLAASIQRIGPRVDSAESAANRAQSLAQSNDNKVRSARSLAVVALIVGAALGASGVLVGVAFGISGRRRRAA